MIFSVRAARHCAAVGLLALAVPTVAQSAPNAPAQLRAYRINPGDEIEIYVWGEERLQRIVKVLPDGTFSFPLVGQIDALGKLPADIETLVSKGLRSQYRDTVPQVTVSVKSPMGLQFSVAGKVKAAGAFTAGRYVNVLEALVMAGGPADFADVGNVAILRKSGTGLNVIKVRLTDILKGNPSGRDLAGLPQLESGDTVIVP
ncbi:polysaccharide biosynthesis/export family protein [Sphingomonas sp. PvP056]|jgi:polysaccharide export outer membrane protein|uniref:polysaccharide biosynthesis/export family protein n=1 Tax=Sphingomonas sp. PvP056 TaxID=3156392 RepID=UPI00263DC6DF|nr:polysaccharide biosynthesis/export family protein [Sphingomonas sp. PsM26]